MKKMYYVPETEITWVTMEQSFLSNGENVTINKDYADMLSVNSDTSTGGGTGWYDGGGVSKLLDGDVSTYWHSAYGTWCDGDDYNSATAFDSTYGIYFQVALTEALQNFHVEYVTRTNNAGRPRAIVYGGSDDGSTWTILGTCSDSSMDVAGNIRVALPEVKAATSFTYLRFGIISSGDGGNDLRTGGGSTNLAEFALYKHL